MNHVLLTLFILLGLLTQIASAADIILDTGHSLQSSGAVGCSGRNEYYYNKELTESVRSYLERNGKSVAITNNTSLASRSDHTANNKVFISIHHDSVQPQFVTKNSQTGGYCSSKATGFSIFVSMKNINYQSSLKYARQLGNALVKRGLSPTSHHAEKIKGESRTLLTPELGIYRFDDLLVLKDTKAPAVLLEAAVIVNSTDEDLASSPEFKIKVSEAVLEMITTL